MTWRLAFFLLLLTFIIVNCSRRSTEIPPQVRIWKPEEVKSFHPPITVQLGWVPYQDQKLVHTGDFKWKVVRTEKEGGPAKVPVLFVESAVSKETIMLNMNIENELLGRLVKHSAITQQPIQRPFGKFFEEARCQSCHPAEIDVDFDR